MHDNYAVVLLRFMYTLLLLYQMPSQQLETGIVNSLAGKSKGQQETNHSVLSP